MPQTAFGFLCGAMGVWGAIAGSVLLLMRSRYALTAFWVSLIGLAGSSVWQFLLADIDIMALLGTAGLVMSLAIWAVVIALVLYARRQVRAGVLR